MRPLARLSGVTALIAGVAALWYPRDTRAGQPAGRTASAEERAVAFLCREVASWRPANKCFSCHNNGDAARALYLASCLGYSVPKDVLDETTRWLEQPSRWEHNGGEGPFSDKGLARLQFAAALRAGVETKWSKDRQASSFAVEQLAKDQGDDGSWLVDQAESMGSPAAYGRRLGTATARALLVSESPDRFRRQIVKADQWIRTQPVQSVMDASATLLAIGSSLADVKLRHQCIELLEKGQSADDGGWGPYARSPSENFDTALGILGLSTCHEIPRVRDMIARARAYLVRAQADDGSWAETTRPPGGTSYAQHVSTTAWATLALLRTRDFDDHPNARSAP